MDCMVEMDTEILKIIKTNNIYDDDDLENNDDDNDLNTTPIPPAISTPIPPAKTNKKRKKFDIDKQPKNPNFVKSNSLGILSVANFHKELGPLILNWEGGYSGEKKIQEVKPLLKIKRINVHWQRISLTKYYQSQAIDKIMNSTKQLISPSIIKSRENEGLLKIYINRKLAEDDVQNCEPLSAVVSKNNRVYIGYRPLEKKTRSVLTLVEIVFDDSNGSEVSNMCWMSPIKMGEKEMKMKSIASVVTFAKEFCLLLPQMNNEGTSFINNYYAIGHKWSERQKNGKFELSTLNISLELFHDWYPCTTEETIEETNSLEL